MGYEGRYCVMCILIPEMSRVELVTESPKPGYGNIHCPLCRHVYGMWFCPYIPQFVTKNETSINN